MRKFGFSGNEEQILVAVSGGLDSMVLATMLKDAGFKIGVAHCNYQLRGEDSDNDETLVADWCVEHQIKFHLKKLETKRLANRSNSSIQMVARDERYRFFEELMNEFGYTATALAHHANDRVESLLLNVLRGTGIRGLQGMPSNRGKFIRPLINFTKEEVRTYGAKNTILFREDASNQEIHYQRNWVRLRLLPMLLQLDKEAFAKLLELCERVEKELPNYNAWVASNLAKIQAENGISIDEMKDVDASFTLLKELLGAKGFSTDQVFEVLDLLDTVSGSEICSESHRVIKNRDVLLVADLDSQNAKPSLEFEVLDKNELKSFETHPYTTLLDADRIDRSAFELRRWQEGDRFKPLGMKGWKLLSDFFIDQKLSLLDKERTWLLTINDQIVWVVGFRLDDRFKILDATQKVLKITAKF